MKKISKGVLNTKPIWIHPGKSTNFASQIQPPTVSSQGHPGFTQTRTVVATSRYLLFIGVSLVSALYLNCCCQNRTQRGFFKPPGLWACDYLKIQWSPYHKVKLPPQHPAFYLWITSASLFTNPGPEFNSCLAAPGEVNKLHSRGESGGNVTAFKQGPNEWLPWSSSYNSAWPQSACDAAVWWICSQSGCQALACQTQADNDRAICCVFFFFPAKWNAADMKCATQVDCFASSVPFV